MHYKYPETEKLLGDDRLKVEIDHLEKQLEAAYWASGKWIELDFQTWVGTLDTASMKTLA